jgi:tryptophan halogenase
MRMPEALQRIVDLFRVRGRLFREPDDLFTDDSWIAVMLGQGVDPLGYDPLTDMIPADQLELYLRHIAGLVEQAVQVMSPHGAYVREHCFAGT